MNSILSNNYIYVDKDNYCIGINNNNPQVNLDIIGNLNVSVGGTFNSIYTSSINNIEYTWQQFDGIQGLNNNQLDGFNGYDGIYGFSYIGMKGFQGNQGILGNQGIQTYQGYQGLFNNGSRGYQGFQNGIGTNNIGFINRMGIQGQQGLFNGGTTGSIGIQGIQGIDSIGKIRGSQGIQGYNGFDYINDSSLGFQGIQGVQGTQGLNGDCLGLQGMSPLSSYNLTLLCTSYTTSSTTYTLTPLQFTINTFTNGITYNDFGFSSGSTLTIPLSGIYVFVVTVQFTTISGQYEFLLYINNTTTLYSYPAINTSAGIYTNQVGWTLPLNSGDQVVLGMVSNTASSTIISSSYPCYFTIVSVF